MNLSRSTPAVSPCCPDHSECACTPCQKKNIALLNNKGVQYMERNSELSETAAMYFFRESLKIVGLDHYIQKKSPTRSNGATEKKLYTYQRDAYDEGMGTFSDPITIRSKMSSISVSTAIVFFNTGILYLQMNEDDEAFRCFSRALDIKRQQRSAFDTTAVLGDDGEQGGLSIVAILHNIGYVQYRRGLYKEAIQTYTSALQILRRSLSSNNNNNNTVSCLIHTAATLNCLGVLNYHLSEPNIEEAMNHYLESIAIRRSVAGNGNDNDNDENDKHIASTLNNIGRVHYLNKDDNEAVKLYTQALCDRRRLFGNYHADVAATVCNIGQACHRLGNLKQALEYYEEFIAVAKKCLGDDHRDVAMILKMMAQIHEKWENLDTVKELYVEAISIGKKALGGHHEEIASTLNQFGNFLYKMGDLDGAITVYEEGLEMERVVFDEFHPNIVVTLSNLGGIHMRRKSYKAALVCYNKVLTIQQHTSGNKSHLSLSATLSCLAMIHFRIKCYEKAFSLYQEALVIQLDYYDGYIFHSGVASTLYSIGLTLYKMKAGGYALEYFQKCLQIRRALLGSQHIDLVTVLFNVGSIYLELGDTDEGFRYYGEGLGIARSNARKSKDFDSYLNFINYVGNVHQHRGELDEAMDYFLEALDIQQQQQQQQQHQPKQSKNGNKKIGVEIARTFQNIGNLYLQKGQTADMVDAFSNALRHLRLAGKNENELTICGFDLYGVSRCHPECAAVA